MTVTQTVEDRAITLCTWEETKSFSFLQKREYHPYSVLAQTESCFQDLRSKSFPWEKRGLWSKMRTKWGTISELLPKGLKEVLYLLINVSKPKTQDIHNSQYSFYFSKVVLDHHSHPRPRWFILQVFQYWLSSKIERQGTLGQKRGAPKVHLGGNTSWER